jgi:hypothetical protein
MSHRLKLNALHFAQSLEEEKKLLEGSEGLLESKSDLRRADIRQSRKDYHFEKDPLDRQPQKSRNNLSHSWGLRRGHGRLVLDLSSHSYDLMICLMYNVELLYLCPSHNPPPVAT